MKIGIFTGRTSVRSKNIFTDISRYPTEKHEITGGIWLEDPVFPKLFLGFRDNYCDMINFSDNYNHCFENSDEGKQSVALESHVTDRRG